MTYVFVAIYGAVLGFFAAMWVLAVSRRAPRPAAIHAAVIVLVVVPAADHFVRGWETVPLAIGASVGAALAALWGASADSDRLGIERRAYNRRRKDGP